MGQETADYLCDQLSGWARVTAKRMFGGFGLYREGLMFGLIAYDVIYFKTGPGNREAYEQAGYGPFTYGPKPVKLPYHEVPADALEDESTLAEWAEAAWREAVAAQKQKKAKPKKGPARRKPVSG